MAHKADVKARARDATAAATQRAKAKAAAATRAVAGRGAELKEQLGGGADQAAPDEAPGQPAQAARTARRRGAALLAVAVGVVLVGWLVWRWRRG